MFVEFDLIKFSKVNLNNKWQYLQNKYIQIIHYTHWKMTLNHIHYEYLLQSEDKFGNLLNI